MVVEMVLLLLEWRRRWREMMESEGRRVWWW